MKLSIEEVNNLPNILEVLDVLAKQENINMPPLSNIFPGHKYFEDGYFIPVRHGDIDSQEMLLMPASQAGLQLYRGQNKVYAPSYPSFFRDIYKDPNKSAIARLKAVEFSLLLSDHPVLLDIESKNCHICYDAICQHYGFPTDMLDLTSNKWVAAFMATTVWNPNTGEYTPVGRDFEDGYGVIYVSQDITGLCDEEKLFTIGFQFFKRPSLQFCFGFKMEENEDFTKFDGFKPFYFRHDIQLAECIYSMAYNQKRFSPNDYVAVLANKIKDSNKISRDALEATASRYYSEKPSDYLYNICVDNNIEITEFPVIQYDPVQRDTDIEYWVKEGRERLISQILSFWPVTKIPLK